MADIYTNRLLRVKVPDWVQHAWPQVQVPVHLMSVTWTSSVFSHRAWARLKRWSRAWFMCARHICRKCRKQSCPNKEVGCCFSFSFTLSSTALFFFFLCVLEVFKQLLLLPYCIGLAPYVSVLGDRTRSLMWKLTSEETGRGTPSWLGTVWNSRA